MHKKWTGIAPAHLLYHSKVVDFSLHPSRNTHVTLRDGSKRATSSSALCEAGSPIVREDIRDIDVLALQANPRAQLSLAGLLMDDQPLIGSP